MSAKDIERLNALLVVHDLGTSEDRDKAIRAILQALREPSVQMQEAGWAEFSGPFNSPHHVWQAMIDHLLAE